MTIRNATTALLFAAILLVTACNNAGQEKQDGQKDSAVATVAAPRTDSLLLQTTFQPGDTATGNDTAGKLAPIKANFKRINAITAWTTTDRKELDEATEGSEAIYYYANGTAEKIVTRHFGETFQKLTEYYLLKGNLSFVYEKTIRFNRPMYYDSAAMKENNDTEKFDLSKSKTEELRTYFEKEKLIHQISKLPTGSQADATTTAAEEKRIVEAFKKLAKNIHH
jgi:hypothetical protein